MALKGLVLKRSAPTCQDKTKAYFVSFAIISVTSEDEKSGSDSKLDFRIDKFGS